MAKSIREVLAEFREHSLDERDKGARFEQLMKDFLRNDTQYQRLFDEVWLWSEYPDRGNRPDTGIDLVARERDTGELVAIQCKFYAPDALIGKPDIDSFLASSSKAEFKGRMLISTSDNWGKNAEEAIAGQKPEVARIGLTDLDESSIDWSKFSFQSPQNLEKKPRKTPRPHQQEAIQAVLRGFEEADRGKLIMACGTGKTFTSLKIVEQMFPNGGTVLFLVPSISLLSQALKEWTIESETPLRSYAVCSDVSVGKRKNDEDLPVTDLAFPATTNTERLVEKFTEAGPNQNGLTVIFSTYQSIDVVAQAQSKGVPEFDLIVCDEAHRTTGVTLSGDDESAFVKVHNQDFIKGKKRLYMTATPKVFSDASSKKAEEAGAVLADMGNPEMFGEEFHRLGFGEAVERGILTDYKVLVLAVDEAYVARRFQRQFADDDNELKLEDAAKIVGCWNGLSKRSTEQEEFQIDPGSMKRAVAFARSIAESKKIASMFQAVVDEETAHLDDDEAEYLRCEVEHVDGSFNSLRRNEKLDWLRQEVPENTARILSNARCLTEGVDVPALDAVMFLNPRDSQVDVVQAVGRVMRKLEGKKYGYVILPIGVPADMDPATALNDNKKYKVVWQVLQALRSHDERFDAMVNKIDLTKKAPQIGVIGVGGAQDENGNADHGALTLDFPNFDQWRDAILAKVVQKVGAKNYWENWAHDVATIAERFIVRVTALLEKSDDEVNQAFVTFLKGLQDNLNPGITESEAIEMLAQHMVTKPVFDALFEGYEFTEKNPVSRVMERMLETLEARNLAQETDSLAKFYDSVRLRAKGIESSEGRQTIIKELYERFFKIAFPNLADRLGIVYTPIELVDFIIHSTEQALQDEFGASMSDHGVHVLDPFTGTGTFVVRLLQSGLIKPEDMDQKFRYELHANEIVLLAYYVAAINIEETFHAHTGRYLPFEGIVLTDTFQMTEGKDNLDVVGTFFENSERALKQNELDIRVIIGNPPYSIGQGRQNDENQNMKYEDLDSRITTTYAQLTTAHAKNSLFDQYIRAFRWATDRIGDKGVVCFVSNGGWLDSNSADGFRKTLAMDFSSIQVLNLRGNIRKFDKSEGENVFGSGSMTPITVTLLVKNPNALGPARIRYIDIGESLSRQEKLSILSEAGKIQQLGGEEIEQNSHGDWINQRSDEFLSFIPMGVKGSKGKARQVIFKTYTGGIKTNRDAWAYNFSTTALEANMSRMINFYNSQVGADEIDNNPRLISWDSTLLGSHRKGKKGEFSSDHIRKAVYRPFVKTNLYFDRMFNNSVNLFPQLLPHDGDNLFIVVPGPSDGHKPSVFITDSLVDIMPYGGVQCFPLYDFQEASTSQSQESLFEIAPDRGFAISEVAVAQFQRVYARPINEEDIFYYVFGILNSSEYQERFRPELKKLLPQIPFARDFDAFSSAGRGLAAIQLSYETYAPYPLEEIWNAEAPRNNTRYYIEKMTFGKGRDRTKIIVNSHLTLAGIPLEAYEFRVQGKSAIEWIMSRYLLKTDRDSGNLSDPNEFNDDAQYLVELLKRVVAVSVDSLRIINDLPKLDVIEMQREQAD